MVRPGKKDREYIESCFMCWWSTFSFHTMSKGMKKKTEIMPEIVRECENETTTTTTITLGVDSIRVADNSFICHYFYPPPWNHNKNKKCELTVRWLYHQKIVPHNTCGPNDRRRQTELNFFVSLAKKKKKKKKTNYKKRNFTRQKTQTYTRTHFYWQS